MDGVRGALQNDPLFNMPTTNRKASFELLVSSQNGIGWDHLLRGRFSHHWVQIQQDHIDHDHKVSSKKFTGKRWLQQVINHIWTHLYLAWKLRNADLHGIDAADQEAKRKAKLKPAIVALYESGKKLDYLDRRIFDLPLDKRLDLKSHEQTAWINLHTPTVRQALAEAADKLQKTQRDIREFMIRPAVQPALPRPPAVQINGHPIPRLQDG